MELDPELTIILILAFIVLIIVTVFGLLVYSGLFVYPRVITARPCIGRCRIAYKFIEGPYDSTLVGYTFTEVTSIDPKRKALGIYYDDPKAVPGDKLRCAVGCVIEEAENPHLEEKTKKIFEEKGYKFYELPPVDEAVRSQFPYTFAFSIYLAPSRVYPAMTEYIRENSLCAYPMVEVYHDSVIDYFAPLSKQEDFFVPEAQGTSAPEDSASAPEDSASAPEDSSSAESDQEVEEEKIAPEAEEETLKEGNDEFTFSRRILQKSSSKNSEAEQLLETYEQISVEELAKEE